MLLDNWTEFSSDFLRERGFDNDFYPFYKELIYDEVEDAESEDDLISYIGTVGIGQHIDDNFPNYSYHLIVRNSRLIAKGYRQNSKKLQIQRPGTIIILNNWKPHHVTWDKRIREKAEPLWISAFFDSNTLLDKKDVSLKFREFIKNI